jgi:hypothetical protein
MMPIGVEGGENAKKLILNLIQLSTIVYLGHVNAYSHMENLDYIEMARSDRELLRRRPPISQAGFVPARDPSSEYRLSQVLQIVSLTT